MPEPWCFYYYSFVIQLEIKDGNVSSSCFIVQGCSILGLLCNHIKFEVIFSISMKNSVGILVQIALNL